MNSIASRAFLLGYMYKVAAPGDPGDQSDLAGDQEPDQQLGQGAGSVAGAGASGAGGAGGPGMGGGAGAGAGAGAAAPKNNNENYAKLAEMLKGLWPGAAIGAGVAGVAQGFGGRKKPGNTKRTIMMMLAAGVPVGVIAQIFTTGVPGGTGAGGWAGLKETGSTFANAGRAAVADAGKVLPAAKAFAAEGNRGVAEVFNNPLPPKAPPAPPAPKT